MTKRKVVNVTLLIILVAGNIWSVFILTNILTKRWRLSVVQPSIVLPTAIVPDGDLYEFCVLHEDNRDQDKAAAGTPIPYQPIFTGSTATPQATYAVEPIVSVPTELPTMVPNILPIEEPPTVFSNIEVVSVGTFVESNYHFVLVGTGYDEAENQTALEVLIAGFQNKFIGINVDFAYVKAPIDLSFQHIDTHVVFTDDRIKKALFTKIKSVYPANGFVVALKTTEIVGTAEIGAPEGNVAILASNNPYASFIFTHEMGHMIGTDDGYNRYIPPEELPDSELFYLDEMRNSLVLALDKLGYVPPMFVAGTCNGKYLYTFYATATNIYGNIPNGHFFPPEYFNNLGFTDLQIIEMNNFISNR